MSYFLIAFIVGSVLSLLVVISIQLSQSKSLLTDRVRDVVALKQNEMLNSIALEDWVSLEELIEDVRGNLNVERLEIQVASQTIEAKKAGSLKETTWHSFLGLFTDAAPLEFNLSNDFGNFQARLTVYYESQLFDISIKPTLYYSTVVMLITFLLVGLLFFGLLKDMHKNVSIPVRSLAEKFKSGQHGPSESRGRAMLTSIQEVEDLFESLSEFERLRNFKIENEKTAALNKLAAQVAHDIRSPLAALDTILCHVAELPEDIRVLVRQAIGRIKDISNDLVHRFKAVELHDEKEVLFLIPVIEAIVSEKRVQFENYSNLRVDFFDGKPEVPKFVEIESGAFKRVISNLVNNSVEAMNGKGVVNLAIEECENDWIIKITDDGPGFGSNSELINSSGDLNLENLSLGMGLKHANESMVRWGGRIQVSSSDSGTVISLILQKRPAPNWSLDKLNVQLPGKIVIVDDDESIHQVLDRRFQGFKDRGLRVEHIYQPQSFETDADSFYLVDYEFRNSSETGLELIRRMGIASRSVLVTSHFENRELIAAATAIGLRILPKSLAVTTPIEILS